MTFENVIGQDALKRKLTESIREQRVSHAQLFSGPEGSGNLSLALAFVQYLLCSNKNENDACGSCSSCIKMQKLIHPDVHFSFPVIRKKDKPPLSDDFLREWREVVLENPYFTVDEWFEKIGAENKQGNITAEECHSILRKLSLKSFEGDYKVLLMWRPEYLGKEGNVLLKLFEEPPAETLILLVAETPDLILGTILSRMQMVRIPPIEDEAMLHALQRQSVSEEKARQIVRLSDGNYHEALALLAEEENEFAASFRSWMLALHDSDWPAIYEWIEETSRTGREQQKSFFQYSLGFIRDVISGSLLQNQGNLLPEQERKLAAWMVKTFDAKGWNRLGTEFEKGYYHIERNANPKMLFMKLSLSVHEMIHQKKVLLKS